VDGVEEIFVELILRMDIRQGLTVTHPQGGIAHAISKKNAERKIEM